MIRKNIYDKDLAYTIIKHIVDLCTRRSYRRIEVKGKENIPTDGAVLLAPNHTNTLMDALVVLQTRRSHTVFGARADMFKRPFIAKLMYFVRILPMVRQRDGLRNVLKNHETTEIIVDTLENGVPFCMYPEGRHRPAHSLLPLGKGITRAAVAANNRFGNEKPVYIVPVGIEYGDYFRYRSTCMVTFGEAINVTEFIKNLDVENEAQIMEPLKQELATRMSGLITYIKDDEKLQDKWSLTRILARSFRDRSLTGRMKNNQVVVSQIENVLEEGKDGIGDLLEKAADFDRDRTRAGISIKSFGGKCLLGRCIGKGLLSILGLPYFLFSALASLPMWGLATFLRGKIKDKAFGNTVNLGVRLGLGLVWVPIWILICFLCLPWYLALAIVALSVPSYDFYYDYLEFMRIFLSDCRLMGRKDLRKSFKAIQTSFIDLL